MSDYLTTIQQPAPADSSIAPASGSAPARRAPRRRRGGRDPRDLRKRTPAGNQAAQVCIDRARHLPAPDCAALIAVLRDGMSVKELAALHAERRVDLRALRNRLKRTSARVLDPKFAFVTSFLEPADPDERRLRGLACWSPRRRAVAHQCIVLGRSLRRASITLDLSYYLVRKELSSIDALFESHGVAP